MKLRNERNSLLEEIPEADDPEICRLKAEIESVEKLLDAGDLAFPSADEQFIKKIDFEKKLRDREDELLEKYYPGYPKKYNEKMADLQIYGLRIGQVERPR